MNKLKLNRFIQKYNLAGLVESVAWKTNGSALTTKFISDDKTLLGEVELANFAFEAADLGVYTTSNLNRMLSVMGEDIDLEVGKIEDRSITLNLKSGTTKANYQLADLAVIPSVPDLKSLPAFDIEIDLDGSFIDRFIKGKNALSDVDTFTVVTEKGDLNLVLGYSNVNSNRITYTIQPSYIGDVKAISFSSKYLKEILVANKDANSAKLQISTQGLAHIAFQVDDFTAKYYLVEVQLTA
jgi:hypothetical protein